MLSQSKLHLNTIDITGHTFGEWLVLSHAKGEKWLCRCSCGKIKEVWKQGLRSGESKSCGCKRTPLNVEKAKKLGALNKTHGKTGSPEYRAWQAAKNRCYNSRLKNWKDYGGRGIVVCDQWLESFENFLQDMGRRPTNKHSLERKDFNGPYSPDNCIWATKKDQANNTRRNVYINYEDRLYTIAELCEKFNISDRVVYWRISSGWEPLKALTTPVDEKIRKRVKNNKNKGRILQNYIRNSLKNEFPELGESDIKSQIMGVSGIDIELSSAALNKFPVSIECKNYTKISKSEIYGAIEQAKSNAYPNSIPIVCFREKDWSFNDTIVGLYNREPNLFPFKSSIFSVLDIKKNGSKIGSLVLNELNRILSSEDYSDYKEVLLYDKGKLTVSFIFWREFIKIAKKENN